MELGRLTPAPRSSLPELEAADVGRPPEAPASGRGFVVCAVSLGNEGSQWTRPALHTLSIYLLWGTVVDHG